MVEKRESSPQTRTSKGEPGLLRSRKQMSTRVGGNAALDGDDEVAIVVGDLGAEEVDGAEEFAVEFAAKDELVVGVASADGVQVKQRALAVGARVVEAFAVGREDDGVVDAGGEFVFE